MARTPSLRCLRVAAAHLALVAVVAAQTSFLVLVADDLGVDRVGAYGRHPDPRTPHLDALAAQGVLFRNAWANPVCSPSRAALFTGRHGFRTGIGSIVRPQDAFFGLALAETTIPEMLGDAWTSVALGKWHLAGAPAGLLHPEQSGFRLYAGAPGGISDYYAWTKTIHGAQAPSTTYETTDVVDDAVRLVTSLLQPWFLYVAFHAPHEPAHAPPPHLHTYTLPSPPQLHVPVHVLAMVEAMDAEIGRLLAHVDLATTTVVFLGDNGTAVEATTAPFNPFHAKATLYEGGVNVPLIVAGAHVARPGSECAALVGVTDLFATVAELAGRTSAAEDSVSFAPYLADPSLPSLRATLYAERFRPNGPGPYPFLERRAIRDGRFKLIVDVANGTEELYDLETDPMEMTDLLVTPTPEHVERAARLRRSMAELRGR